MIQSTQTVNDSPVNIFVPFSAPSRELRGSITTFDGRTVARIPFAQLADDVARARERLVRTGLEPGACVGVLGENCYEWMVYDLALLSLGCLSVCFPVDEFATKSEEELAEGYDLSLLLVTRKVGNRGGHAWVMVMNAPETPAATVRPPTDNGLRRRVRGTDACTVIFSSGTSGRLKALLLSRAGVDVTVDALANDWELTRGDGILVALPLSIFQQRVMIFAALRKDTDILLTDSVNLFRSFKALRPTIVLGPPALFEAIEKRFLALPELRRRALLLVSRALGLFTWKSLRARLRRWLFQSTHEAFGGRIRVLLTGSAPSKPSTLDFFEFAGLPLFQAYGLAEVGFIAWNRPARNRFSSVGHPIVPNSVSLAEDQEIILSLPHPQSIGYFGVERSEEALTFLPDGRIATGDLGKFDQEGYLYITGRKKNIILLQSGEKVHPETLEVDLAAIPGVERAVVVGGGEIPALVAIVAVDPECTAEQEARIRTDVQSAINRVNLRVKPASRIARFIVTRVAFRPETGLVTRNLKLDRQAIHRRFERELTQAEPAAGGVQTS
ncbi:AMP-binding protein [Archangium lansingense]|uniref:AMP-binding protein n=1 Tax=Archangium lansingense TaxID=2995310 RepID=A0ABT4ACN3_9BACT|nr:AMP-binding protein [Archangium lansinium]MCY1079440.1 AMP-binding protein [Archangium lansinium]